jgi:hypothetical protein
VSTLSRGRSFPVYAAAVLLVTAPIAAQRPAAKGNQRPTAAAAPAAPPQIAAAAIRIVGPGFGASGTELRPFNESPGTVVVLAIQAPRGSGIVQIDDHASTLDAFSDDKGQSLLEEGRVGPFPKVAEDGSAAIVEVEVRGRPSAGAASVSVQGSLTMMLAAGSKPVRASGVKLAAEQPFKIGATTMTVGEVKTEEESTSITFNLPRSVLYTIREVRLFDAKNAPIEARRTGSGYFNEKAELMVDAKTKDKTVTVEFELWQNPRTVKVPFNAQAGLGVAAGGRAAGSNDAPAAAKSAGRDGPGARSAAPAASAAPEPPPTVSATEGAESVEAVVKQLQTAALAGKGARVLSVIYPTERAEFGQGVAMALAFLPMASMGNEKEGEAVQKELDAFFNKHQLKPPFAREPADLFKGVDLTAFVSDAMVFLKNHAKKGDNPADVLPVPQGRPENVKITGDAAVATLGGKEIKFTKISGRWFIRLN